MNPRWESLIFFWPSTRAPGAEGARDNGSRRPAARCVCRIGWTYPALPRGASALSLAVGVCVRRALHAFAGVPVQLKWPNDLLAAERKLGGILIELRAESAGPAYVVIGVGINCALGEALSRRVQDEGTNPIDLAELGVAACDRNRLGSAVGFRDCRGRDGI